MATETNVNLNQQLATGQTGAITSSLQPGLIKFAVLVPAGTTIPAASCTDPVTFASYVKGFLQNNSYGSQWFGVGPLSEFKDATEADSIWKTAPYSIAVFQYPHNYQFNYLSTVENFVEITQFQNWQGDYFFIDWKGQWWGALDTTGAGGLKACQNQQFWVGNRKPMTDKTGEMYPLLFQFGSVADTNQNFKMYAAGYTQNPPGFQNVVLQDQSSVLGTPLSITTTTTMVVCGKIGQDSLDLMKTFGASIAANPTALVATDLTSGATLTISTITNGLIVVSSQQYYYLKIVLSAPPTATHQVQITLASPSVVLPLIPALNGVVAIPYAGVNGANAAVKTF